MQKPPVKLIIIATALLVGITLLYYIFRIHRNDRQLTEIPEAVVAPPVIQYIYGIPLDSFSLGGGVIHNNQMISNILNDLGISFADINTAMQKTTPVFDVRKFKAGNKYLTFSTLDSIPRLEYFVYEKDPINYLVFHFADSVDVWNGFKQIDTIKNSFAGSIQTSLWNTFTDKGRNPMMANELSEIYAWTIDFFGLQQGDSLRVVYDEYYVDSVSIGIGKIHGAWFRHMNRDFWAIPFVQDSVESFFDDEGQSLRKAFLKAPLRFSRISSRFSNSRMHPILKIRRPHHGVDYSAPVGTPVYSIGDGAVVQTGYNGGAGNMVKIKHNSIYTTVYMHLSKYATGIRQGVYVRQGDVIGYVGSTGLSTGPHLDFRFYKNGSPVDPLKVEAPPVDPVKKENSENFLLKKTLVVQEVSGF
jgi:murein DD-endopeptidase MepM/ murein hydrolase activator NlpD